MKLPFRILGALTTLWILYTLYQVSRFGGAVVIDPGTISRIMAVRNEDVITTARMVKKKKRPSSEASE